MARPKKAAKAATVLPYTLEQLKAMLAELEPKSEVIMLRGVPADTTVGMSIDDLPRHVIADKSSLPPAEDRKGAPVSLPANTMIVGDPRLLAGFGIQASAPVNINPATGFPHNQVIAPPRGGTISPPPSRNFRGS
jgi:hypothetical protein